MIQEHFFYKYIILITEQDFFLILDLFFKDLDLLQSLPSYLPSFAVPM